MSILLTKISDYVVQELNRRTGSVSANTPSDADQLWLYGKTPWAKMQSNAYFTEGDTDTLNKQQSVWVLQSGWGKGSFNDSYEQNVADSFRPKPGIVGVDVAIKGHLGMMREAKVKYKAYTLAQLEIMQSLYMTPGIGVLLEWGWSVPSSIQSSINLFTTTENGPEDRWLKQTIQKKIDSGKGLYDALFGLVSDFSFTMADDGTWDCETTLIGPGAMTVDINLNVPGNALGERLIDFIETKIANVGTKDESPVDKYIDVASFRMDTTTTTPAQPPAVTTQEKNSTLTPTQRTTVNTPNLFVTWAFVEDSLNQFFGKQINTFTNGKLLDSSTPVDPSKPDGDKILPVSNLIQGFDTTEKGVQAGWRSFSPTNVLIPTHPPTWTVLAAEDDTTGRATEAAITGPFITGVNGKKDPRPFQSTNDKLTGDLRAVFLNYKTIVRENLLNSETVQEAIHKILSALNEAAAGIWDLTLLYNDDYSSFRVVDFKSVYGADESNQVQSQAYKFAANVKSSIVKGVAVNFRIPNALKVTAMISVNAPTGVALDGAGAADRDKLGIFRGITRGVADRFAIKSAARQNPGLKPVNTPQTQNLNSFDTVQTAQTVAQNEARQKQADVQKQQEALHTAAKKKYFEELNGDEKTALINAIYNFLEGNTGGQGFANSGVIPGDVSVTINGIAGLKWGNAFQMTNLPARYVKNVVFQIKDIANEISSEGWSTTITGLMRARYNASVVKQTEIDVSGIPQTQQTDENAGSGNVATKLSSTGYY